MFLVGNFINTDIMAMLFVHRELRCFVSACENFSVSTQTMRERCWRERATSQRKLNLTFQFQKFDRNTTKICWVDRHYRCRQDDSMLEDRNERMVIQSELLASGYFRGSRVVLIQSFEYFQTCEASASLLFSACGRAYRQYMRLYLENE